MSFEVDPLIPALKTETTNQSLFGTDHQTAAIYTSRQFGSIGPFAKDPKIYKCPSDASYSVFDGNKEPRVRSYSISPAMNSRMISNATGPNRFRRVSEIRAASRMMLFIDEHEDTISSSVFRDAVPWNDVWGSIPSARHSGAGTLSYVDGHVETHKWRDPQTLVPIRRKLRGTTFQNPNTDRDWLIPRIFTHP